MAMLRNLLIGRMGRCGDEQVVEEAKKRFRNHRDGKEKLPGDLRSAVSWIWLDHSEYFVTIVTISMLKLCILLR